jgi:predicted ATPase/DNA-binding SARP family transcriptional activator
VLLRLLASPNRVVPTDVLAEDVWEGEPPAAAASTLQSHVSALRQLLGPDRLFFGEGGYRARVGPAELDAALFEADIAQARIAISEGSLRAGLDALEQGLGRWRGSPFADAAGAAWTLIPSARLEEERNAAIEEALETRLEMGLHYEVCVLAEEAVASEPLRERRWAVLMLALYRAGRQAEALRCYQRARQRLGEELGIEPSPQLARLENDILLQSDSLGWAGLAEAVATAGQVLGELAREVDTNLPAPVSGFVGREREMAELDKLLGAHRLVSIVGMGGIGKTRLAIEVARSRLEQTRDGVWFVDLADVRDPGGLASAVAVALGVRSTSDEPLEAVIVERARDLSALVVFDNCEHLVDAVAALVEGLLEAGAGLRVLATSREALRVPGERIWQAPPIATPEHPDELDATSLADFDAVRLFVERAGEAIGGSGLSVGELRLIGTLTTNLDGLPLAIELAAARAGTLGLAELASLDDRLGLLGRGSRTAHSRQQTLTATIDWSYQLLPAPLRMALRRLSVFAGGFTLEAAGAVAPSLGDVREAVVLLAERSLVVPDRPSTAATGLSSVARFRMLETIRQFAIERLRHEDGAAGDTEAREAHIHYFAELSTRAAGALTGWHQGQWLTTLEDEYANLSAAIGYWLDQPALVGSAVRMIVHLDRFWHNRGHLADCASLLRRALELSGADIGADLRCAALNLAAQATAQFDPGAAVGYLSECLPLARDVSDSYQAALALQGLSWAHYWLGDPAASLAAGREGVDLAREMGDPVLLGQCLVTYGLNIMDDLVLSKAVYQEAIDLARRSGDRMYLACAYNNLGCGLMAHHHWADARENFERTTAIFEEIGMPNPAPVLNLGWVHLHQGEPDQALEAFTHAVLSARRYHLRYEASYGVLGMACLAAGEHDYERAAALIGFADAELDRWGQSWPEPERSYRNQALNDTTRNLGSRADTVYDSGRIAERDEMLSLALRLTRT